MIIRIVDLSPINLRTAMHKSHGRNWKYANTAMITAFGDCARVEVYWNDGAVDYLLCDSKADAVACLSGIGFTVENQS